MRTVVLKWEPMTENNRTNCTIRCRTASTPTSQCECSCGGANHGQQQSVTDWGVTGVEESDPFTKIHITESGVEVETKRETVAGTDEFDLNTIEVGDTVTVFHENAVDGWQKHHRVEVEAIRDGGVLVEKQDGFYTVVPPTQIPVDQFRA